MRTSRWNPHPTNFIDALKSCRDYAYVKHGRKVMEIAEIMGETEDTVSKWISTGRMPGIKITTYEMACGPGCHFATDFLGSSDNRAVISLPRGTKAGTLKISDLQRSFAECVSSLTKLYAKKATVEETLVAISDSFRQLAWHKVNVEKHHAPELPFGMEAEDE